MSTYTPRRMSLDDLRRPEQDGKRLAFESERPWVSAHDGPRDTANRIRRAMKIAGERIREGSLCAACPAAALLGTNMTEGITVRCGVEKSLITERKDPSSLASYCLNNTPMGGYTDCPTWRAEKEREWHGTAADLVPDSAGV